MMSLRIPALFLIVSSMGLLLPLGESIWLTLPPLRTKCVSEEIQNGVSVLAKYNVISADQIGDGPAITVKVTSPSGSNIYRVENATDDWFEFNTTEAGKYLVCFWMGDYHRDEEASVYLDWKIGIAARDWDSVAKEEKLLGVELELRKQEEIVESIHEKMLRLMGREMEMRVVIETIHARVTTFSIMSLGINIVVSALQLWYLKRYFRKKKII